MAQHHCKVAQSGSLEFGVAELADCLNGGNTVRKWSLRSCTEGENALHCLRINLHSPEPGTAQIQAFHGLAALYADASTKGRAVCILSAMSSGSARCNTQQAALQRVQSALQQRLKQQGHEADSRILHAIQQCDAFLRQRQHSQAALDALKQSTAAILAAKERPQATRKVTQQEVGLKQAAKQQPGQLQRASSNASAASSQVRVLSLHHLSVHGCWQGHRAHHAHKLPPGSPFV